ncbi:Fur family transcriptional regulator [uncultured Sphingomonas sp.]|uniref:Fur family transcriptional regulator n=1 Tax=uncultured Sphingomonas sp. TaxID=158754 RepID=UPI00260C3A05|nr:transcriptional repressor [uncultured Sphingomonas sp.]
MRRSTGHRGSAKGKGGFGKRATILPGATLDAIVLDALVTSQKPLSVYQLVALVADRGYQLPAMSIYRSIDRLELSGAVERVQMLSAYRVRDKPQCVLAICTECGDTISIAVPDQHEALRRAIAGQQFAVSELSLEASGKCSSCLAR